MHLASFLSLRQPTHFSDEPKIKEQSMLNPRDAIGLQEDLAIIRNAVPRAQPPLPAPDESGNAVAVAVMALRARADSQARLLKQIDASASERNEVVVSAKAARETIDVLVQELARHSGLSEEECQRFAKEALSRRYDALLDQAISNRQILRDIRRIPDEIQKCRWYSPAP
jgi:hypothetical protein